jgi:mono/diheme cytochrome c family protein
MRVRKSQRSFEASVQRSDLVAKTAMIAKRSLVIATGSAMVGWLLSSLPSAPVRAAGPRAVETSAAAQRALLDQHCVTCHNQKLKSGNLTLDGADLAKAGAEPEIWEKVIRKLRLNTMPPPGRPRPDAAATQALVTFLKTQIDQSAASRPNPGRVDTFHRLNRAEYKNAVRDLLLVDVDVASLLPADDSDRHGFDNTASMLSVSPMLIERYLSAARKISRVAVGISSGGTSNETYKGVVYEVEDEQATASEELPFGSRGGIAVHHTFPVDGEYGVSVRLRRNGYDYIVGLAEPHQLEIRIDGVRVSAFTVGGEDKGVPAPLGFAGNLPGSTEWEQYATTFDDKLTVRVPVKAGARVVGVSFVSRPTKPEGIRQQPETAMSQSLTWDNPYGNPAVENIKIDGPYNVSGVSDTPSRRRLFVCRPPDGKDGRDASGEGACARKILAQIARRAYRRPVSDAELDTLVGFFTTGRGKGFDAGIELALERLLTDPNFLFRVERDPAKVEPGTAYRISDLDLASRLSFFLWSSIPDEALLDLAVRGRLHEPSTLAQQVQRMMADARASALVDNFAGQWLQLRNIASVTPSERAFPEFDELLRRALRRETELFVESNMREDRSLIELLTANYSFINERLARHYKIPNVYGEQFRRVTFADGANRGGLLGQGSLLTITSYPTRTSPVLRGKWVLENILGSPPPPPPPNVPGLPDRGEGGKPASVRERLEQHRKNPTCATCHMQMDPIGFALENFDGIGKYRTISEAGGPVDAKGAFPAGGQFEGLAGLRSFILGHREAFVETFVEKLLAYAIGRELETYDFPTVRKIQQRAAAADYRWSSIILGIVSSAPFEMRKAANGEPVKASQ